MVHTPPPLLGGVAADGAVGQRGRASIVATGRRRSPEAELPLTVQLVSVVVPPSLNRPPPFEGGVAADGAVGQRGRADSAKSLANRPPP